MSKRMSLHYTGWFTFYLTNKQTKWSYEQDKKRKYLKTNKHEREGDFKGG